MGQNKWCDKGGAMMQIVKYEINKDILIVGFKVDNFIVYSQIAYDENKTKDELLQLAYIQAKPSIEYEKTLDEHSFVTDEEGEVFVPEQPKPSKLDVDFSSLTGKVLDQYGDIYSEEGIDFYIEDTDKVKIENGEIIVDYIEDTIEYKIVAKYGDLTLSKNMVAYPQTPSDVDLLKKQIEELASKDELFELKKELLDVQEFIVNKQYEELLKEGGI